MLGDPREVIRRKAVLRILQARREYDQTIHPRQFVPPKVDFNAQNYYDLIDWEVEPCTEPPVTMDLSLETVMDAIREPLRLPDYPNNTQAVERMVRVVTEVATKRAGYNGRHTMILQLLHSRKMVPKFNTKMQDAVF
jgi:hypothetical protein